MRLFLSLTVMGLAAGLAFAALAQGLPATSEPAKSQEPPPRQVDVSADQSLEWYQDQRLYVARGNAKAIRGDMVVDADLLTAHERDKPQDASGANGAKAPKAPKPAKTSGTSATDTGTGDIDKMTAEGHVRITDPKQRITGEHAVYDLDKHTMVVTGNNLKYETEKEIVTAKDSLEYYEDKKIAVARGDAVADSGARHVEGDVLTAEFRDTPSGQSQLTKMTALGHVTVITKGDVSRGDKAVYDMSGNVAILTGNVRIARADGTQLSGDVGEVDFATNQSRLLNNGTGRVRALLAQSSTDKAAKTPSNKPAKTQATKPVKTKPAVTPVGDQTVTP